MELYGCVKELAAVKCGLWPNSKTDSYRAINRTCTLKLTATKNIDGIIHSRIHLSLSFCITAKRFRTTLTRSRLRICVLRSHKAWFLTETSKNSGYPMCGYILEDGCGTCFISVPSLRTSTSEMWTHRAYIPAELESCTKYTCA